MADVYYIANPTPADITVNSNTAKANHLSGPFTLTTTTTDLYAFVSKGCVAVPGAMNNTLGPVSDVLDSTASLVEKGGRLVESLARAVLSAGNDTFGVKGL